MAVKCKITGSQKVKPTEKGACPECTLPGVKLTPKGNIATHNMPVSLGEGPLVPVTDEGTRVGDPRDAAVRREVDAIHMRTGAAPVPEADTEDVASVLRGPTLFRGRSMKPFAGDVIVSPVGTPEEERTPGIPEDKRRLMAGTMSGNLGRERPDAEAFAYNPRPTRTNAQKRKFRARQTAERQMKARLARQANGKRA